MTVAVTPEGGSGNTATYVDAVLTVEAHPPPARLKPLTNMSSVSGSLTAVPPLTFKTEAEYNQWSAKFGAMTARYSVGPALDVNVCHLLYACGLLSIPLTSHHSQAPSTFTCTSDLKGRLYPHPHNPHFYFLDFIDDSSTRRDVANLHVYPYEYLGPDHGELEPMRGRRRGFDVYMLLPPLV